MVTLKTGSVNSTGNLTTTSSSNSNEATNEYNSVLNLLSSGNSVAGMEVTSAQVTANGGEVQ